MARGSLPPGVEYPAAIQGGQNHQKASVRENAAQQEGSESARTAARAALLDSILALLLQAIVFRLLFGS